MHLVNDVELVPAANRSEADVVSQFTDLIHAVIACAINFQHVEADALRYFPTGVADSAWSYRRTMDAIERFSQNAGGRGLAGSPWADKKIGVSESSLFDGIF